MKQLYILNILCEKHQRRVFMDYVVILLIYSYYFVKCGLSLNCDNNLNVPIQKQSLEPEALPACAQFYNCKCLGFDWLKCYKIFYINFPLLCDYEPVLAYFKQFSIVVHRSYVLIVAMS